MNPMRIFPIRHIRTVLLLVLALLLCVLSPAQASAQLPTDIRAQFGSIEITGTAYWDTPGSTWFVLIRTPDRVNRLLCYTLQSGTWVQEFQAAESVPQERFIQGRHFFNTRKIGVHGTAVKIAADREQILAAELDNMCSVANRRLHAVVAGIAQKAAAEIESDQAAVRSQRENLPVIQRAPK